MPQLFAHRDTQACTHTGAHTLFERGNSADDAWVFVMDEGTSICWSTSWCFSLFRQAKKLQHKMHYLAPVCQPSCLYLIFSCLGLSPGLSLCVCVRVCLKGTARWTLRSSWRYWGPNCCRPTTGKDSWATPSTTSSGRWKTKLPRHSCSLFLITHNPHSLSVPSFTPPLIHSDCISAVRTSLTSLSTALVSASTLHRHTPT